MKQGQASKHVSLPQPGARASSAFLLVITSLLYIPTADSLFTSQIEPGIPFFHHHTESHREAILVPSLTTITLYPSGRGCSPNKTRTEIAMRPHTARLLPLAAALLAGTDTCSNFANANPVSRRMPDNTQPVGTNPIANPKVDYLGFQTADNSCSHRDLGFTGAIAGKYYAVWGDTLWCDAGVTDPAKDTSGFHGMVRDAVSATTNNPLLVHDLNLGSNGRQNQFVPFNASWGEKQDTGFGGTSLVEVNAATKTGAVFYLVVSCHLVDRM